MFNTNPTSAFQDSISRRQALKSTGAGFGYLALAGLLGQTPGQALASALNNQAPGALAPRLPQFPAKAKRIIFLFMQGAMSQMDTWEYKAQLEAQAAAQTASQSPKTAGAPVPPVDPDEIIYADQPAGEEVIQPANAHEAAWAAFCQALLGSAEFRYLK